MTLERTLDSVKQFVGDDESRTLLVKKTGRRKLYRPLIFGTTAKEAKEQPNLNMVFEEIWGDRNACWLLKEVLAKIDPNTNVCSLLGLIPKLTKRLERGFPVLRKLNVLRRVKPHHYMINPHFVAPFDSKFDTVNELWKTLPSSRGEKRTGVSND